MDRTKSSDWLAMILWRDRFGAFLDLVILFCSKVTEDTEPALRTITRRLFPSVQPLPAERLMEQMAGNATERPLIIDARGSAEFAVSHLQGAQRCHSIKSVLALRSHEAQPVVVYCSIGLRSAWLARRLQKAGLTKVWNLEGSLFGWANAGRPVYRGQDQLVPSQVHPYSSKWAQLLQPMYRADLGKDKAN
jgi:rhodanese-related sulfurtransferase